jgi:Ca-activated chloride channel family protein
MTFIWPAMLFLLILVPLFGVLYARLQARRRKIAASFSSLGLNPRSTPKPGQSTARPRPEARRFIPPALFMAGLTILIVALARPQSVVSLPHIQGTVILAFDVSGSMAADDLKPTRMDAAKAAAREFVKRQPTSVQIGVVGFSDSGFAVQAPSNQQAEILAAINRLTPQRGTSLGHGIEASLNTIAASLAADDTGPMPGEPQHLSDPPAAPTLTPTAMPPGSYTSAVIILLSDGDNNENPNPMATAQNAADRGIRIYTIGIGSAAGTALHINGFNVFTRLNEDLLKQISQLTGGTYYNADSAGQLMEIYDHLNPQLFVKPEKIEITSIFAGASIFVLIASGLFSLMWYGRLP